MMSPVLLVTLAGAVYGQYPQDIDIFRAADVTPNIMLLLDNSCSMQDTIQPFTDCPQYITDYAPTSGGALAKWQQLQAVLVECTNPTDGIIHQWVSKVNFGMMSFTTCPPSWGPCTPILADFGSTEAQLVTGALGNSFIGDTPTAVALGAAGQHFNDYFNDSNSKQCRPNYIVLMTDGLPNDVDANLTYSFSDGETLDVPEADAWLASRYNFSHDEYCMNGGDPVDVPFYSYPPNVHCDSPTPNRTPRDMISGVTGIQPIRNYAIGVQTDALGDGVLQNVALEGDGAYYHTDQFDQLNAAFTDIISRIVTRSNVQYSSASTQSNGIFSGNFIYFTSFKPVDHADFFSTMKKNCIFPYDATGLNFDATRTDCLFTWDLPSQQLFTNPTPKDIWSNTAVLNAQIGGTGQQIFNQNQTPNGPTDPVPANPYGFRHIMTWRPGTAGYISADPNTLTTADTFASPTVHGSFLNFLWGYTYATNLTAGVYSPAGVGQWPEGDTVHSPTALLKYTTNCETPGTDHCWAVVAANDGMLHFFDTTTGQESSAMIPAELFPPGTTAVSQLKDIYDQPDFHPTGGICSACDVNGDGTCSSFECCTDGHTPCTSNNTVLTACAACDTNGDGQCDAASGECLSNGEVTHRFYFDGGIRLFHDDLNGNLVIDPGERAFIVAGLGRGGRAYYQIPVNPFNGVLDSTNNPPSPLVRDGTSEFQSLRETWNAPVFTTIDWGSKPRQRVAIFATGHINSFDSPTFPFGQLAADLPSQIDLTRSNAHPCSEMMNEISQPPSTCDLFWHPGCTPGAGFPAGCYDSWAFGPQPPPAPPQHYPLTLNWSNGSVIGVAYRLHFTGFDLQPGDYLELQDGLGNAIAQYAGTGQDLLGGPPLGPGGETAWVYGTTFKINFVTNGVDDVSAGGIQVGDTDVVEQDVTTGGISQPSIYAVGVDNCAGCIDQFNGTTGAWAAPPTTNTQNSGIMLRVTSDCGGTTGPNEICLDKNGGNAGNGNQPDLAAMVCPISSEPSVYAPGGIFDSMYFGDECGQIWKVGVDATNKWFAQLLLRTNQPQGRGTVPGFFSKDYRKVFTKVDLAITTCNGARGVGVYFGTGNLQRPGATDNLQNPAQVSGYATNPGSDRNVYGVVWDSTLYCSPAASANCSHGQTATLDDLFDATNVLNLAPTDLVTGKGANGWFISVGSSEIVNRDPVVFQGVAFFKTYQIQTPATECQSAVGLDRVYAVDNCSAKPVADGYGTLANGHVGDQISDREAYNGQNDGGSGILVITPKGGQGPTGQPIVSVGLTGTKTSGGIVTGGRTRTVRVFNWWRKA
jgi:hypothetical protein